MNVVFKQQVEGVSAINVNKQVAIAAWSEA